eukprot:evm.model.scf_60.21 EVM.evm.TU.scf_60.21   scf_60:156881-158248(-)
MRRLTKQTNNVFGVGGRPFAAHGYTSPPAHLQRCRRPNPSTRGHCTNGRQRSYVVQVALAVAMLVDNYWPVILGGCGLCVWSYLYGACEGEPPLDVVKKVRGSLASTGERQFARRSMSRLGNRMEQKIGCATGHEQAISVLQELSQILRCTEILEDGRLFSECIRAYRIFIELAWYSSYERRLDMDKDAIQGISKEVSLMRGRLGRRNLAGAQIDMHCIVQAEKMLAPKCSFLNCLMSVLLAGVKCACGDYAGAVMRICKEIKTVMNGRVAVWYPDACKVRWLCAKTKRVRDFEVVILPMIKECLEGNKHAAACAAMALARFLQGDASEPDKLRDRAIFGDVSLQCLKSHGGKLADLFQTKEKPGLVHILFRQEAKFRKARRVAAQTLVDFAGRIDPSGGTPSTLDGEYRSIIQKLLREILSSQAYLKEAGKLKPWEKESLEKAVEDLESGDFTA